MHKPLVSIIALNYNQSRFLVETLNSINRQTYNNFELIITDDGSIDDSVSKINAWAKIHPQLNIQILYNQKNAGLCAMLNSAVKRSKGVFIKPIACDDILEHNYLERVVSLFQNSCETSLICTDMSLIDEESTIKYSSNWNYAGVNISEKRINEFDSYIEGPFLNTPSIMYRRELFDDIGGYDESLIFEDWDFILRSKKISNFAYINESLVRYRIHNSNMHKNIGRQIVYSQDIIRLLNKHFGTSELCDQMIRRRISDELASMLLLDENFAIKMWKNLYPKLAIPKKAKLSVLTTVYNCEKFILNAIYSILLQTYSNIELVIIADPGIDGTVNILRECRDKYPNIILVENEKRLGIISSFNIGLTYCEGEYIARMDLDDLIHPQRFERQMEILCKDSNIDIISSWMKIFDEKKQLRNVEYRSDIDLNKITMLFYSPFSHAASIFKSEILKTIKYLEDYKYAEDYDLWFRIFKCGYKVSVCPEYLYFYRTHTDQVTNERNVQINMESSKKIGKNILDQVGVAYSPTELDFHVQYLMLNKKINSLNLFLMYDKWLTKIWLANQKTHYFVEYKFLNFIFVNYWQQLYLENRKNFNAFQLVRIIKSPFNKYGIKQKTKDIIKQLVNK